MHIAVCFPFSCTPLRARLLVVLFGLASPTLALAAPGAARPNVLLMIADDLRPQLGCYGYPVVKTPHLDAFARHAVRFDRAYVQVAVCSPSRNSFLSGLRPGTTGLRGFGRTIREAVPD